jgi:peptidoglycan hydrolase-like protein with peptidoglycan-binding domain
VLNSKDSLKEIQRLLSLRGYDVGPIDGLYGSKVRKAISNFQSREGLKIDGQPPNPARAQATNRLAGPMAANRSSASITAWSCAWAGTTPSTLISSITASIIT